MPNSVYVILACSVAASMATNAYGSGPSSLRAPSTHWHLIRSSQQAHAHAPALVATVPATAKQDNAGQAGSLRAKHKPVIISDSERRAAIAALRSKHLGLPIKNADVAKMKGSFYEMHGGEMHGAVDILQPRNTPVLAVEDGVVAKLFTSRFGGLTIYQFDPQKKYVYYYAHLQKYADVLHDGQALRKGQVIGFVGTSGNAPPNTPHLHFSIAVLGHDAKWWQAAEVDPYDVFR